MGQSNQIPSLPELALQYGTIDRKQFSFIQRLHALKQKKDPATAVDQLMLNHKFATGHQVGLLRLIQDYLVIRKQGEAFGAIAIDKGFATRQDVKKALEQQKKAFQQAKLKKLIGDILVESCVITVKQKNEVLKDQQALDAQVEKIFAFDPADRQAQADVSPVNTDIPLSEYEQQFLKIRVLDKEFAASVVEKKFATQRQVKTAQKIQERAFKKTTIIKRLGDIMVELNHLTLEQKNQVLREQEQTEKKDSAPRPSPFFIHISPDRMQAVIAIQTDARLVRLKDIKQGLKNQGIKFGIYPDAILQCNLDMGNLEFIAARQNFSLETIKNRNTIYSFDTQTIGTETKKKGMPLAEQGLEKNQCLKKDLFGQTREQSWDNGPSFRCHSGTRLSQDKTKAFAGKTGTPSLSIEKKLYVHPCISVLEDADLKYGPLEPYANLTITGVLTGAYPITAGNLEAREIRGAQIQAVGCVTAKIGITDSVIITQGDVHARYLHNCRIETFGNVYVENEIIDSTIFSSGKIDSGNCHVITSTIYGKKGIELGGAGNARTRACVLGAGTEHHVLEKVRQINQEIKKIGQPLLELKEKKDEQDQRAKKIFQKMIELKIFHDRTKNKKEKLTATFKQETSTQKEKLENTKRLDQTFEKRMAASISSLKKLNRAKKRYEQKKKILEVKINQMKPGIEKKISDLQLDLFAFLKWAGKQENLPQIKINQKIFPGTLLKGIFSSLAPEESLENFSVSEKLRLKNKFEMVVQKNNSPNRAAKIQAG